MLAERLHEEFASSGHLARLALVGAALILVGMLTFVVGTAVAAVSGQNVFVPLIVGFVLVAVGGVAVGVYGPPAWLWRGRSSRGRPRIAEQSCPKCGSPPGDLTANGFTRCASCGNPYFAF